MNAIKHLHNRFEYAIKGNGTIRVNQHDVEAINMLVDLDKTRDTELEDSLLLFYLLWTYQIENEKNKLKLKQVNPEKIQWPIGLTPAYDVLNRISKLLHPKKYIIDKIHKELLIYQRYERLPEDQQKYIEEWMNANSITQGPINFTKQNLKEAQETDFIKVEDISKLLESALSKIKHDFPTLKHLTR